MTEQQETVYVSIGNSDGRLSQPRWASFWATVDHEIRIRAERVFGTWASDSVSEYGPNACWAFLPNGNGAEGALKSALSRAAREYGQESIAWAKAPVEMIGPPTLTIDGAGITLHGSISGPVKPGTVIGRMDPPPASGMGQAIAEAEDRRAARDLAENPGPERRPQDWEHLFGVKVMDPKGWVYGTGDYGPRDWEQKITEPEWHARVDASTVNRRPLDQSFRHNPWSANCGRNLLGEPTDPRARCRTCEPRPEDQHASVTGGAVTS